MNLVWREKLCVWMMKRTTGTCKDPGRPGLFNLTNAGGLCSETKMALLMIGKKLKDYIGAIDVAMISTELGAQ